LAIEEELEVKILGSLFLAFTVYLATVLSAQAAAPFYEGKSIRLIVGFSDGGGFDTY
jgi:tripartite-type tricarboxylate transporter receptor subunit TctC